jgi:tRNA (guanine37-N1)-methyltransferase
MPHMLKEVLADYLIPSELNKIFSAFDVIGDIVIIKIPDSLMSKKEIIGEAILNNVRPAKSVFIQTSEIKGEFRVRNLEFLAGEEKAETEYKEHGCRFRVDVTRAYFSPRLSTERLRVANLVGDNEVITNMFGGVGTYSILMAKKNKTCRVYNIDSNPVAIDLCRINAKLNKVENNVISILGDAREVIEKQIVAKSNRVLMPLPEKAKEFVSSAVKALNEGKGIIHYFAHVFASNRNLGLHEGKIDTKDAFKDYRYRILQTKIVREVGPRLYQIVSDVYIGDDQFN